MILHRAPKGNVSWSSVHFFLSKVERVSLLTHCTAGVFLLHSRAEGRCTRASWTESGRRHPHSAGRWCQWWGRWFFGCRPPLTAAPVVPPCDLWPAAAPHPPRETQLSHKTDGRLSFCASIWIWTVTTNDSPSTSRVSGCSCGWSLPNAKLSLMFIRKDKTFSSTWKGLENRTCRTSIELL